MEYSIIYKINNTNDGIYLLPMDFTIVRKERNNKLKVTIGTLIEENEGIPTMKYKIISKLGEGSYGTVYLAENITTKNKVAMKQIKKKKENILWLNSLQRALRSSFLVSKVL